MNERSVSAPSGIPALIGLVVLLIADIAWLIYGIQNRAPWGIVAAIVARVRPRPAGDRRPRRGD